MYYKNGVTELLIVSEEKLKQMAISFNKIYVNKNFQEKAIESINNTNSTLANQFAAPIEYLIEKGIIELHDPDMDGLVDTFFSELQKRIFPNGRFEESNIAEAAFHSHTRLMALSLQKKDVEAFPIFYSLFGFDKFENNRKTEVLNFAFKKLPLPSDKTSWEQIFEFRSDKDVQSSYLALINWVNKTARTDNPVSEIEDEFNYLYDQYMKHYRLHKMKSRNSTVEILVSLGIDVLTAVEPANGLMKNLFAIRKNKIALMEEELKLPGREIAYIYKANEKFRS